VSSGCADNSSKGQTPAVLEGQSSDVQQSECTNVLTASGEVVDKDKDWIHVLLSHVWQYATCTLDIVLSSNNIVGQLICLN